MLNLDEGIKIEHVEPRDSYDRIFKLLIELDDVLIPTLSSRVRIQNYAEKIYMNAHIFYVVADKNDIGKCAVYYNKDKKVGYITSIAVKRQFQGKGIGETLIKQVIGFSRRCEMKSIELQVWNENQVAIMFYKKIGFELLHYQDKWMYMQFKISEN